MMARANPKLAMRPFLPADTAVLVEIFRTSINELTSEDYSPRQQEAWASTANDEAAFGARLAGRLTLLGTMDGSPVGFAALEGPGADKGANKEADKGTDQHARIDMLYVHPAVVGLGVGSMLIDALEKLATARGVARLTADVSDSAQEFFKRRGFVPRQRNTVTLGDEWLANTTMDKQLAAKERAS